MTEGKKLALLGRAELQSLKDVFASQIGDLYDAENRLAQALPKMVDAAGSAALKQAFEYHLSETEGHVSRLETILRQIKVEPKRDACEVVKWLIAKGEETIRTTSDLNVKDGALIAGARRVQQYGIAGYGTACKIAQQLGLIEAASLLQQTLNEEVAADLELNQIAESSTAAAPGGRAPDHVRTADRRTFYLGRFRFYLSQK